MPAFTKPEGSIAIDPMLTLLQRYIIERRGFDEADASAVQDWDKYARDTWVGAQDEIIASEPPATTAAGALLALEYVLQSDQLFAEQPVSAEVQMLWQLVKSARDYIASLTPEPLGPPGGRAIECQGSTNSNPQGLEHQK